MALSANSYNRQAWENAEFPLLCETCLGDNPYIRMMKEKYGQECKVCERPFTVFRWCPGAGMRYKKTEICQTCSKLKNICQTCLLDLEFGLPVQVRDNALNIDDSLPKSSVNKEYFNQIAEKEMAEDPAKPFGKLGKVDSSKSEMLAKLSRKAPYYKRNRPHVCSFWVKGECKRGEECPYRHEAPNDPEDPLSNQNIKDRFYGTNDPVADKLMKRYQELKKEETVTTVQKKHAIEDADNASKLTPGLPGVLAPPIDIKNDFFNLTPFSALIPPPPPPPPPSSASASSSSSSTTSTTLSSGPSTSKK